MIKQFIAIILLSVFVVFAMSYAQQGLQGLIYAHDWISQVLYTLFSHTETGNLIRSLIALLVVPLLAGLTPAIIYWFARRRWFPYFMQVIWAVWLIQTGALLMLYKMGL